MKKRGWLWLIILFIAVYYLKEANLNLGSLTSNLVAENKIDSFVADEGNLQVYFCPREDCAGALVGFIDTAQEYVHCALFEIDHPLIQEELLKKSKEVEVQIVTDNNYLKEFNHSFVQADSYGLMHNKFCVIDGKKISSGSMNPTENCAHKNNNNLLLIHSKILARNYEEEFQEMWSGVFKKGEPVLNPKVKLGEVKIKNYFCPEDKCAEQVEEELKKAKESIYFMTFSFTHKGIANILLLKKTEGVKLQGVMDASQISDYSVYELLEYQGVDVLKDGNKYKLHHKVFLIDTLCVITGSFNPTEGGDTKNDENLLIICDKEIAMKFKEEFDRVYAETKANN